MAKEATVQVRMDSDMKERVNRPACGILSEYANPALIEREKGAFASAMEPKHG